jgi:uncharacterized membrane protein YraQ (UPF0718 family)
MNKAMKKNKISGLYFLAFVILVYLVLFFTTPENFQKAFHSSWNILKTVVVIVIFVIILSTFTNYFLNFKKISKYLGKEAGIKGWLISAIAGIISHGPPYVWLPLIKNLQNRGMSIGYSAVFLYTRAIKIPLLPMMIIFFGWKFTIVFNLMILISSILVWKVMEKI